MSEKNFLRQRLGRMSQLASIRQVVMDEGRGRGVRLVEIDNGSGLSFTVMPDRCCDIFDARFKGVPLAWLSANGVVNPNAYEPEGLMWLRSWPGGLLTTAGFLNVGGPDGDHGLHGRAASLSAEALQVDQNWVDDDTYELSVTGTVRHTMVFGEKLELRRKIFTRLGDNKIYIQDTVENQGFAPVPMMMLYHCNFGYPLVDEGASVIAAAHEAYGKDEHAQNELVNWERLEAPQSGYCESVFVHKIPADSDGLARIAIKNEKLGLQLTVAYDPATLPFLNQWKQMGEGEYVTGLEPGNCTPIGQTGNAERGDLKTIQPGEKINFALQIEISEL